MTKRSLIFLFATFGLLLVTVELEAAQMVLRVAGTVVGSLVAGPIGGMVGGMIGGMIGSLLFPPPAQQMGPRLTDRKVTSSAYGEDIIDTWGTWPCEGLLIDSSDLKEKKHEVGGKGMLFASPEGYYFTYSVDADWLLRRRQAAGILRVWFDTKLARDISPDATIEEIIASNAKIKGGNLFFYMGAEDQLPDPTMEELHGVGNVPAGRGVVRMVAKNLQLADYSNRVPECTAEVYDLGDQGLKNFGYSHPPVGQAFVTRLSWDYIDENHEIISILADGNYWAEAFAVYNDGTYPLAYTWHRFTPEGWFPEVKPLDPASPGANTEIQHIAVGKADEPVAMMGGGGIVTPSSFYLVRFLTGEFIRMDHAQIPGHFNVEITRYVFKNGRLITYLNGRTYGSPGNTLAEWSVSAQSTLMRMQSSFLPNFACVDMDATEKFLYILGGNVIYKIDIDSWVIGYTLPLPFFANAFTVNSDDVMYATVQGANEGPVSVYSIFGGSDENPTGWGLDDAPAVITLVGTASGTFFPVGFGAHLLERDGIFYYGQALSGIYRLAPAGTSDCIPLSKIVGDCCRIAGLPEQRFDVSELTDCVYGYARDRRMAMVDVIRPLVPPYLFDGVESGPLIKFPKRGRSVSFVIPLEDLAAYENGADAPDMLERTQIEERKLPMLLKMRYRQKDKDYEAGMQTDERILGDYQNVVEVEAPISFPDDEAKQRAKRLMPILWTERNSAKISLTRKYIQLEPSDVVEINL